MSLWNWRLLGLVAAGLMVLGLVFGGLATTIGVSAEPENGDRGKYHSMYMEKLAVELGISKDQLMTAMKSAGTKTVDEAVAAGDLTVEEGDRIKKDIESGAFGMHGKYHHEEGVEGTHEGY